MKRNLKLICNATSQTHKFKVNMKSLVPQLSPVEDKSFFYIYCPVCGNRIVIADSNKEVWLSQQKINLTK